MNGDVQHTIVALAGQFTSLTAVRHIIGGSDAAGNLQPSHLSVYYANGPAALPLGCSYCLALKQWEIAAFRQEGILWLKLYSGTCRRPTGGGSHSGGTHHGH